MDKKKTGELIKKARIEKGYTQVELGDLLGVSNKAVSRWENGDSFPDIGVLENLSEILGVKIQDIVIGNVDNNDDAVTEIVRVAKIQVKQRNRKLVSICAGLIIIIYLLCGGCFTLFSGKTVNWKSSFYFVSLALILLIISAKKLSDRESLDSLCNINKWFTVISLSTGVYSVILMCLTMCMVGQGKTPFNIESYSVGPFLNKQLIFIFFINFIVLVLEYLRIYRDNEPVRWNIYFSVGVMHLVIVYSHLLHKLTSLEEFRKMFILYTLVVLGEIIAAVAITYILKHYSKNTLDSTP